MEFWPFIFSFLAIYVIGGRKIAVPYGIAVLNNIFPVILLTFTLDLLQIPLHLFILSTLTERIGFIREFIKKHEKGVERRKTWKMAQDYGKMGVFILAALPSFGGGVLPAIFLAFILRIDKKLLLFLVGLGSLVGITLLALFSHNLIAILSR